MQEPVIEFSHISMEFPGVLANDDVSLTVRKGEIFALVGENGAGKSTLMNILYGIHTPTGGSLTVKGRQITQFHPRASIDLGVGMVHQHFMLVPSFTVAQNIVLGLEPRRAGLFYDRAAARRQVEALSREYGLRVDPDARVGELSVGLQQRVEILKTLYRGADMLILDEPTAVLTPQETDRLFDVLRAMRDDDKAIIIITHKLQEVLALSDRVTVLRKGEYIGTVPTSEATPQSLTDMMVGQATKLNIERPEPKDTKKLLEVTNLTVVDRNDVTKLKDVSFTAYGGEILGIAGISGCGQKELMEAIAGLQPVTQGSVIYYEADGSPEELIGKSPMKIQEMGVHLSFVPEDRLGMGLVANMGMTGNMMLRSFKKGKFGFSDRKSPAELAERIKEDLEVVTTDIMMPVRQMSGGNVQKVLVGREICADPRVLLTAYAVRGLDINTSHTIYRLLNEQKAKGVAVIYVGEDLDVLLELCDRILVLCGGEISGIVDGRTTTKEEVGLLMTKKGEGEGI